MAFCPNCGSEVGGQFCPKCGTSVSGAAPAGGASPAGSSPMATNLASALCYLLLPAIIFLLVEPYNRNREVRFHAWQSIGLAVALTVFNIALAIVFSIFIAATSGLGIVIAPLLMLVHFGEILLFIFVAFKAYQNQRIVIPVIGPFAEKQA
jgi:uncharacterized membrane protein